MAFEFWRTRALARPDIYTPMLILSIWCFLWNLNPTNQLSRCVPSHSFPLFIKCLSGRFIYGIRREQGTETIEKRTKKGIATKSSLCLKIERTTFRSVWMSRGASLATVAASGTRDELYRSTDNVSRSDRAKLVSITILWYKMAVAS